MKRKNYVTFKVLCNFIKLISEDNYDEPGWQRWSTHSSEKRAMSVRLRLPALSFAKASDSEPFMYYVYVLYNKVTGRYYIGYTTDLRKRLNKHYSGKVLPTKSNLNYRLVGFIGFVNRSDALDFEKYLKTGSGVAFMNKHLLKSVKKL